MGTYLDNLMSADKMTFMRRGAGVVRSHTLPAIRRTTVGEHSHALASMVALAYEPELPPARVLKAALFHDLSEVITGDMPATAKWANPALSREMNAASAKVEETIGLRVPDLTEDEQRLLSFLDLCEFGFWSLEEYMLGNSFAEEYVQATVYGLNNVKKLPAEPATRQYCIKMQAKLEAEFSQFKFEKGHRA